ncbi:hypothetical protein Bcep18194_C7494 [Burkholderia lata]|uniref:Uncharacterized protein n=1 Tax=Burkholderia lata (strain ATCC 17760 / DSM 23089 / LMG 22485 / NCIMB 9086 / R18194 / 383) TaxID=482957 RepID=Q39LX8_BURL3|nr:hypothetical protein Bcep18194_C7494 [Burkholderia lata]
MAADESGGGQDARMKRGADVRLMEHVDSGRNPTDIRPALSRDQGLTRIDSVLRNPRAWSPTASSTRNFHESHAGTADRGRRVL